MRLVVFLSRILVVTADIACGCWFVPASGPASFDVRSGSGDINSLPYAVLKLNPQVIAILAKNTPRLRRHDL